MAIPPSTDQQQPMVHVIGAQWIRKPMRRVVRMVGTTLAEAGLGLVTGDSSGVDRWTAESFCAEWKAQRWEDQGRPLKQAFIQIGLGRKRIFVRGGLPLSNYPAPDECQVPVHSFEEWKREALKRSHAAVMIGGGNSSLDLARRYIERGKPVFPLPMMSDWRNNSDTVFQEILKTWDSHPVPGLSRNQFLRLAEPWVSGTGALANLLRGTLARTPDVFISYRRADASAAAGRLAHDLTEHFGQQRVFMDITGIGPSRKWDETIAGAIASCRAGIVVIGRHWLSADGESGKPRLHDSDDVVCKEIASLLAQQPSSKIIFPVLVEGAQLPDAEKLPDPIKPLLDHQATVFDNSVWEVMLAKLIREIDAAILAAERQPSRHACPSSPSSYPP